MNEAVITGMGVVCALGQGVEGVWEKIKSGESGIRTVTGFDLNEASIRIAAQVPDFHFIHFKKTKNGYLDRVSSLSLEAVSEALAQSGLRLDSRSALVVGSCCAGVENLRKNMDGSSSESSGSRQELSSHYPLHAVASSIAYHLDFPGQVLTVGNACAAGNMAVGLGKSLIEEGVCDWVIAGGADVFEILPFAGFYSLQALDSEPCAPFARSHGLTLGEGAAFLVMENRERAESRRAPILGKVFGFASSGDSYNITAPKPDGEGQVQAMRLALMDAGVTPADLDYLNAHGTGTPLNDSAEKQSLLLLTEGRKIPLPVSSVKGMIGHCLGAAGAIESVITLKALEDGVVPPNAPLSGESHSAELIDLVQKENRKIDVRIAMNNSFAFGGNNASTIFAKADVSMPNKTPVQRHPVYITGIGLMVPGARTPLELCDFMTKDPGTLEFRLGQENFSDYGIAPGVLRKMDRLTKLTVASGVLALKDAKLTITPERENRTGVYLGTSEGPCSEMTKFQEAVIRQGAQGGSPLMFPNTVYNAAAGYLSILQKLKGSTATLSSGFCSGLSAVSQAGMELRAGRLEAALAVGADEWSPEVNRYFQDSQILQDLGKIGEGAVSLVLENEQSLSGSERKIYAELLGWATGHKPQSPGTFFSDPAALWDTAEQALSFAGLTYSDVDFVCGFDNGLEAYTALEAAFFSRWNADTPPANIGVRRWIGESRAAGSGAQVALAALILSGDLDLSCVPGLSVQIPDTGSIRRILVLGVSSGGYCEALVLGKVPQEVSP